MSKLEGDFTPIHKHSKSINSIYEINQVKINNYNNKKKNQFNAVESSDSFAQDINYTQNSFNNSQNIFGISGALGGSQYKLSNSVNLYNTPANLRGGIIVFPSTFPGKEYNIQLTSSKENNDNLNYIKTNSLSITPNNNIQCYEKNKFEQKKKEKINNSLIITNVNMNRNYNVELNQNFEILKNENKWNNNNSICYETSSSYKSKTKDNILKSKNTFDNWGNGQDYDYNDITIGEKYYFLNPYQSELDYIKTNTILNKNDFIFQYKQFLSKFNNKIKKPIVISEKHMSLLSKINWNENIQKINNDSIFIVHNFDKENTNKCPYINHTSLFCNSIRPNKKWNSYEMFKENVERINYVVQKSIISKGYHYKRIKEVYDIEYDEPTNYPCLPLRELKVNWNKLNSIETETFEIHKCSKPKGLLSKYHISSGNMICLIPQSTNIVKTMPKNQKVMILWKNFDFCFLGTKTRREWIYDFNIFIYNEHNHNNIYYDKSYQLFTESELANNNKVDEINYRSVYSNIPLSFTIMGKKPKKRYKISSLCENNITYLPITYKSKPKNFNEMNIANISLSYEKEQKHYEDKSTNEPLYKLTQNFYMNMINKWNKNSIPLTQYSILYKIEQNLIDLKKWNKTIIPNKTFHYSITGKEKRIWNDMNIIETQFHNQFIQDKEEMNIFYIENKEEMQLLSFKANQIAFEEKQKKIKERCIKSKEEIEKIKKELLNNLNQINKEEDQKLKTKSVLKQKKKILNNHSEFNKSANIQSNKGIIKEDNEQLSKTNNMKSTILKEKKKNTSDNFFIGQSFNFNIYTKGLGVQSIKTTLPKENINK